MLRIRWSLVLYDVTRSVEMLCFTECAVANEMSGGEVVLLTCVGRPEGEQSEEVG